MELPSTRYLSDSIFAIKNQLCELFQNLLNYNYEQKHKMIQNGINKRYKTTIEMADDAKSFRQNDQQARTQNFYKQKTYQRISILIFDGNCILAKTSNG